MPLRRNVDIVLVIFLVAALSACQPGKHSEISETTIKEQAEPLTIAEIIVGPTTDASSFQPMTPADPIQIFLRTTGNTEGANLLVEIFALADGSTVGSEAIHLDSASEPEQSIHFERNTPWEPGRYLIEVTLNGKLVGHRELEIHQE